jgi:hypothetical protein
LAFEVEKTTRNVLQGDEEEREEKEEEEQRPPAQIFAISRRPLAWTPN